MNFRAKLNKRFKKILLSKTEKSYSVVLFQKKRIIKKIKIKHIVRYYSKTDEAILKFEPAYFEATHKCYVDHIALYVNRTQVIRYRLGTNERFSKGDSLTIEQPSFKLV